MRRGTGVTGPLSAEKKSLTVADHGNHTNTDDDLEGGGGYSVSSPYSTNNNQSSSISGSSSLDPLLSSSSPATAAASSMYNNNDYEYDYNGGKTGKRGNPPYNGGGSWKSSSTSLSFWTTILSNPQWTTDALHRLSHSPVTQQTLQWPVLAGLLGVTLVLFLFLSSVAAGILLWVLAACVYGSLAALWLCRAVLLRDAGTPDMRAVSDPIAQGAAGFLAVQYTAIAQFALPLAVLIFVSYQFRPTLSIVHNSERGGVAVLGNGVLGVVASLSFGLGAVCSAAAGYVSMCIASLSNVRVASAARQFGYNEALIVCFQGGAFSAVLNLTLCIAGVTSLYAILMLVFCSSSSSSLLQTTDIPILLVGYGFGASFVALFMQLVRTCACVLGFVPYEKQHSQHWFLPLRYSHVTKLSDDSS